MVAGARLIEPTLEILIQIKKEANVRRMTDDKFQLQITAHKLTFSETENNSITSVQKQLTQEVLHYKVIITMG